MDMYLIAHFSLGPLILLLAYIFKRFPPKKINSIYGYRTSRSMRSQEAWDCANLFSTNAMLVVAGVTCLAQLIFYTLIGGEASILWSAGFLVVSLVAVIPITEIHMKGQGFK